MPRGGEVDGPRVALVTVRKSEEKGDGAGEQPAEGDDGEGSEPAVTRIFERAI